MSLGGAERGASVGAVRLTDKQKKDIVADYVLSGTYAAVARKYGVSPHTVRDVVAAEGALAEKCRQKKAENSEAVLQHLGKRAGKACEIIDLYLEYLADPSKLARANLKDLATALGIVVDKFTGTGPEIEKLRAEIEKLRGEKQVQDVHPLVADLARAIKANQGGPGNAE